MTEPVTCWCGNTALTAFSTDYLRCPRCETLVRIQRAPAAAPRVRDDDREFYGRDYWFGHQERDLDCPNIRVRARTDMPERCLYWLRALLQYRLPPARVLEVGSGPGGFLPLLRWAGFDATGLELSPWVVQFIRETFDVPTLCGPVEDQPIEPASLDVIAMMDVLEHLPDPVGTLRHCLGLLRPDGLLLIQTPCYREGSAHAAMVADEDRFLEMLRPPDHLHLFSRTSIRTLLGELGVGHVVFEPALFAEYDMFVVAGKIAPTPHDRATVESALAAGPSRRMVQALLDLDDQRLELDRRRADAEADRTSRLSLLDDCGRRLGEVEGARNALQLELSDLRDTIRVLERDHAARLEILEAHGRRLGEIEGERNALQMEVATLRESVERLEQNRERLEQDRADRLEVIETQARHLGEVEGERNALQLERNALQQGQNALQQEVATLRGYLERLTADIEDLIRERDGHAERLAEAEGARGLLRAVAFQLRRGADSPRTAGRT